MRHRGSDIRRHNAVHPDERQLAQSSFASAGTRRRISSSGTAALLCVERDPEACHRPL